MYNVDLEIKQHILFYLFLVNLSFGYSFFFPLLLIIFALACWDIFSFIVVSVITIVTVISSSTLGIYLKAYKPRKDILWNFAKRALCRLFYAER